MEKKKLKEFAKKLINEGKPRQEILEELISRTSLKEKEIAEIIKNIPSHADKKKNKGLNTFLGIFLILTSLLYLLEIALFSGKVGIFILLFPIINIVSAILVFKFRSEVYKGLVFLNFLYLINYFQSLTDEINSISIIVQVSIILTIIIISLILKSKLTANYEVRKAWSSENSNQRKMIDKIYFLDDESI